MLEIRLSGYAGKLFSEGSYVAGVLFNWEVIFDDCGFIGTANPYYLDKASPRSKELYVELYIGRGKYVGMVTLESQVVLDKLTNQTITFKGESLCQKVRNLRK